MSPVLEDTTLTVGEQDCAVEHERVGSDLSADRKPGEQGGVGLRAARQAYCPEGGKYVAG
ncbi:MAG: hypothetical protein M0038_19540 [Pseudomonadota bacterium]|nr:hypothetical protein [Pseudomonadota bacterium]